MRFIHLAAAAGVFGLMFACTDAPTDGVDTADTGVGTPTFPDFPPLITSISPSCNGRFDIEIETDYWAGDAQLHIFDTSFNPAYDEPHPMTHGEFDPDGYWDTWYVDLAVVAQINQQVGGQSTVFQCANFNSLTYAIEVYDTNNQIADCAVFGHNPSEIINGTWPDGGETNTTGFNIGNRYSNCVDFN